MNWKFCDAQCPAYDQADSKIKCYFCTLKSPGVNLFNSNFNVGHASQLVTDRVSTYPKSDYQAKMGLKQVE